MERNSKPATGNGLPASLQQKEETLDFGVVPTLARPRGHGQGDVAKDMVTYELFCGE